MDRVLLDLGFIKIYYYSIFILLGVIVGGIFVYLELRREKVNKEKLFDVFFYTIIFAFIGARAYYVLFNLSYYLSNPIEILYIWHGGLAIHGGILGGVLYLWYYSRKHKLNLVKLLDILVVGLIIGQVIGRWGNFFNSEAYGYVTSYGYLKSLYIPEFIIRGMYINGDYHMPTFFFESCWNLLGFIIFLVIRKFYKNLKTGQLLGFYMMWYSFIRFIIEGMRLDSLMLGPIRMAQLVSVVLFIVGVYFIFFRRNKKLYREDVLYE